MELRLNFQTIMQANHEDYNQWIAFLADAHVLPKHQDKIVVIQPMDQYFDPSVVLQPWVLARPENAQA